MPKDMTEIKKSSNTDHMPIVGGNGYPWGTELSFENDMIEDLEIGALAPGDVVEVRGFAVVVSKNERSDADNTEKSMSLQMTFLKVDRETDDAATQLYGG